MPNRPSPNNIETTHHGITKQLVRLLRSYWLFTSILICCIGLFAWAKHDTLNLKLEKWDLFYPSLPAALEGKTIVQISDLHLASLPIPAERIRKAISSQKPDLLVLTGDVIYTNINPNQVFAYLNPLEAHYGRFIVMGNNDYSHILHNLFNHYTGILRDMGWIQLRNESEYLPSLNTWIIGIDDPSTAHDDVSKAYIKVNTTPLDSTPFRLVLAHSTDCLNDVAEYGADLLLTGHSHGGQIRLPGFKPWISNSFLGDEGIFEGYHVIKGVPLYINRGLGESIIPFRFNEPPEITVFTLKKGATSAKHVESLNY